MKWDKLRTWLRELLCGHGYAWIDTKRSKSGCHWCGKTWRNATRIGA